MAKRAFTNAPNIDLNTPVKKLSNDATTAAPSLAALQSRISTLSEDGVTLQINGRNVFFKMHVLSSEKIEKASMVFSGNERDQDLLTELSLSDLLPTFKTSGQQFPAIGRLVNGIIEIADGSRRRAAAIVTKQSFKVLVGELSNDDMTWLTKLGNNYQPTSAYERGKRYARRLKDEFENNISALAKAENVDRKIITRYIKVATLPVDVIKSFPAPHDLTAKGGEALSIICKENKESLLSAAKSIIESRISGEVIDGDKTFSLLKSCVVKDGKPKEVVKEFGSGIKAVYRGKTVAIQMNDAPESLLKEIEKVLDKYKNQIDK
ncbi:ParB/RepB/Spo0J family plasmid partition protein [Serratia fonticola]|uniref:ParB/RepB/Spo0J family plasmid partition protein n=1 Tax=Serratia fonticola TaxID=47917 RepID=UPI00301D7805